MTIVRPPAHLQMRGILFSASIRAILLMLALATGLPAAATAHGVTSSEHAAGIPIPSLTHGSMAIIAPYYSEIVALAASASDTNESFRRVLNFTQIQHVYCAWGVMPGSLSDEESPFNECSHAYLAGAKELLLRMRTMPQEADRAGDIASAIDAELVRNNSSLVLCQFSGESFNTAAVVRPRAGDILLHGKSLATLFSALLLLIGGFWALKRSLRVASAVN